MCERFVRATAVLRESYGKSSESFNVTLGSRHETYNRKNRLGILSAVAKENTFSITVFIILNCNSDSYKNIMKEIQGWRKE
jgi:hypothetical protein